MPRRKFPSDRRPWFRCLTDILHDDKLNGDCPPEVAWAYMRLLAMLQQTGSRDGKITLDQRGLAFMTCRAQRRHSESITSALVEHSLCTRSARGVHTELTVRNWAKLQGFAPAPVFPREEERREEKRESPPATPAARPRARKASPKTVCPERLSEDQRAQVRLWRDSKHPELDDLELAAQWALLADHYVGEGEKKADWVRTFYKWLTGPFYKRLTPTPGPGIKYVVRETAPPPADPVELAAAVADSRAKRAGFRGGRLHLAGGG